MNEHPTDLDQLKARAEGVTLTNTRPPTQQEALVSTAAGTVDRVAANAFAAIKALTEAKDQLETMLVEDAARIKEGLAHFLLVAAKAETEAKRLTEVTQAWASDHARLVNKEQP